MPKKPWYEDHWRSDRKLIPDRHLGPIQVDARLNTDAPHAAPNMGVPIQLHRVHRRLKGASPNIDPYE